MNTKNFVSIIAATALFCAGCSVETPVQSVERVAAATYGADKSKWTEQEKLSYLLAMQNALRMQQEQRAAAGATIAQGFQQAGRTIAESAQPAPLGSYANPIHIAPTPMPIYSPQPYQWVPIPTGY